MCRRSLVVIGLAWAWSSAVAGPRPAGKWLVDLGRDYALSPQAGVADVDAEITLLFMQAAARVEPELAEAYLWQYDMLAALQRVEQARESLGAYVQREPEDVVARLGLLALTIEAAQTVEARADICRGWLEQGGLPDTLRSDLHRRLAELHFHRGEREQARSEAMAALQADALNLAARWVLAAVRDPNSPTAAVHRVEMLLAELTVSPARAEVAWELANELRSLGMGEQAERWYAHAAAMFGLFPPGEPPAEFTLDRQGSSEPVSGPGDGGQREEIEALLKAFPEAVLDYPLHPGRYLSLTLKVAGDALAPGEPWWCEVRLANTGPFAITLGSGMMVVPDVLCAIQARGDQSRSSGPTIHISLNRRLRLMPGESIEVRQTVDIGLIRSAMIGTPQMRHQVEFSAVLSPVMLVSATGQEVWAPGVGGLLADPVRFRRSALEATSGQVARLAIDSQSSDVVTRVTAVQRLAMLLAEDQHLAAGRLRYPAHPIEAAKVQSAVLARAADEDWQVRARLAECLRWFVLDPDATNVATRLLQDRHWLVRGLALRALADHYGERVGHVLERYAEADPDAWVRRMAGALASRLSAATQPAGEEPSQE